MSMMLYPALLLTVRIHRKIFHNRTLLHLSDTAVTISSCLCNSFFIAHSEFTGDLKLWALPALLHVSSSNSVWLQRSVWGAHARPDRQTALSTGCPFFALAQPITQSQYKHSFLWSIEPVWKRPFNWSSIKGAQPTHPHPHQSPSQPPPSPPPARGPFTERSSDKQDSGSKLRQSKPLLKPV